MCCRRRNQGGGVHAVHGVGRIRALSRVVNVNELCARVARSLAAKLVEDGDSSALRALSKREGRRIWQTLLRSQ